jgi:Carboxypeptidase regulatory-like domain
VGKLTGTVLDGAGKPIPGARITLSWGMGEMMNVPIDDKDGRYVADALAPGKYRLNVIPGVGRSVVSTTVTLEAGKTLMNDIAVK